VAGLPAAQRAALPHLSQLRIDTGTVVFGLTLLVAVVLAFGLVPALRTSRGALALAGRGAVGRGRRDLRLQLILVTSQVALALMLLSGAGLMTQSVRRLLDVSPGFSTERLLTFRISLSGERYQTNEAVAGYFRTITERVAALPGVEAATAIDQPPLTGPGNSGEFTTVGDASGLLQNTLVRTVAPNYFQALGIAVERGRGFTQADQSQSPRVVLVNRRLADTAFGGQAIGHQVSFPWSGPDPWEIVGITGDERFDAIDQPIRPVLYFSSDQSPSGGMSLLVRTMSEPWPMVPAIRTAVSRVDDSLPMFGFTTMDDLLLASEAVFRRRAVLVLLAGFALVGLVLASVGVYGVLSQIVADRTREIGVRIALGAGRREIVTSVLKRGMTAAAIGMVVGAGGSTLFGQALQRLLFATDPSDATTMLVVMAVFLVVTILACLIPSRRVLRVDPVAALRGD
jgi:putative ABC transport system permease protein